MKPRALVNFAVVTAVVTAAALVAVADRYWVSETTSVVKPFPGLLDHINDVAEIDVTGQAGKTTIKRTESGWVMVEKQNYPVQAEKAKATAIGFGEMEFTERKTTRPNKFARLGVEDPDGKGAKSRLVTLKDTSGKTMARLIVGEKREGLLGEKNGLYVRRPGEKQAWFAPADFDIPTDQAVWLKPQIIQINAKRIARITTIQPNGDKLVIYKETPQAAHFAFKDLPPGKELKGDAVADDMDTILTAIDLADVAPQSEVEFTKTVWHAEIETFDGLVIKVDLIDKKGKPWARFNASTEKAMIDRDSQPQEIRKDLRTPDEVVNEAAEINARLGKWAYEIEGVRAAKLEAPLQIFLQNETPSAGAGSMGGFGPGGLGGSGEP